MVRTDMKRALIIFTRVPEPGKTKTRLQALLTKEECAEMHEAILLDQQALCDSLKWDTFVYFTPDNGREKIMRILKNAREYIPQENIEFGSRMRNCIKQVLDKGYDACLLVGTDIPELNVKIIEQAFNILENKDVVIGATKDKGYYLIGMNKIHDHIFENQVYGTGNVYDDTVEKIKKCNCTYDTLPVLRDVDEPEDLQSYFLEYEEKHENILNTWKYLTKINEKYRLKIDRK